MPLSRVRRLTASRRARLTRPQVDPASQAFASIRLSFDPTVLAPLLKPHLHVELPWRVAAGSPCFQRRVPLVTTPRVAVRL